MNDSEEKSAFRVELEMQGRAATLERNDWLSADELGRRIAVHAANPQAAISQLLYQRCIVSISVEGAPLFPPYAFDGQWHPLPVMQLVLVLLYQYAVFSDWRIAAWFEFANGHLSGARPRRVLVDGPDQVEEAAGHRIVWAKMAGHLRRGSSIVDIFAVVPHAAAAAFRHPLG